MSKKIIGYIELGIAFIFLLNVESDIQLGFGLVLLGDSLNKIID